METDLHAKLAHTTLTMNQENERIRSDHQSRLEETTNRHLFEFEAMRSKMQKDHDDNNLTLNNELHETKQSLNADHENTRRNLTEHNERERAQLTKEREDLRLHLSNENTRIT
jgi:hypothetical protein